MHSQYALCRLVRNLYTPPACLLNHKVYALADYSQSQQFIAGHSKSLLASAYLGACGWALLGGDCCTSPACLPHHFVVQQALLCALCFSFLVGNHYTPLASLLNLKGCIKGQFLANLLVL
ncbi:hypothetical protein PROFUN_15877 [Planoprotostelium fungivorum]|uniref:Uncharacterized protein n=1 Tax=Planoprotostelium fungivorum TaxID=1890364 RepID=A0A2P6MSB9_9EUKA|nr:hypothetical protein PROFUN_15877 [Planoprotostelium fungivorum]